MPLRATGVLAALALAACARMPVPAPAGPSAASPAPAVPAAAGPVAARAPERIDLRHFFASRESNWGYRVSPDGRRLGWMAPHGGRTTIHFRDLEGDGRGVIDTHSRRNLLSFSWAADSRHVLYHLDEDGDENYHVWLASTDRPGDPPRDLTPWPGRQSTIDRILPDDPGHVTIRSNRRDPAVFDLYRLDLATGEAAMVAENPGDVFAWLTDQQGRLRARIRQPAPEERRLEVHRAAGWVELQRFDLEEFDAALLGVGADDRTLWLLSGRGRDRRALVRVDMETGIETVVWEHPEVDADWATLSSRTRAPLLVFAQPDRPLVHALDPALARDLDGLPREGPAGLWLISSDREERRLTVEVYTEKAYASYLIDRATGRTELLGRSHTWAFRDALATTEPIAFPARDGVRLRGYLTRPPGAAGPGPLVVLVHGGHWARDRWIYDRTVQFLANRGWAVLQVNYRGSTGYGRAFRELAVGEYAGRMHLDLVDGVRWAVERGVADPRRVAIYGGSYGGYAALVGMTFTPEVFACGVSVVGMSNLVTLLEQAPAYWKGFMPLFHKYVGDPSRPEDRRRLEERSPLFRADRVQGPLLLIHGARDVRVRVSETEQMAEALRRAGKDVRVLIFPDEGHRRDYGNWRNAVRHHATVEAFLDECRAPRAPGS